MLGMVLREIMGIMLLIKLTTLQFVSTVAISIRYRIVSVLAIKQRSHATGKGIWKSALTALLVMEGTKIGTKVVVVMARI